MYIIIWCHPFSLSPTLTWIWGCSMLRGLLSIGHVRMAHECLCLPQMSCSSLAGCSAGNGPHFFWTLFSLVRLFPFPTRFSFNWCDKSSKKSKFPLIVKKLLLLQPYIYFLLSFVLLVLKSQTLNHLWFSFFFFISHTSS